MVAHGFRPYIALRGEPTAAVAAEAIVLTFARCPRMNASNAGVVFISILYYNYCRGLPHNLPIADWEVSIDHC
jgi:hypothetical protein